MSTNNKSNVIAVEFDQDSYARNASLVKEYLERLPKAIQHIRDEVHADLKATIQNFFHNVDDVLFEKSERATTDSEQNIFFE